MEHSALAKFGSITVDISPGYNPFGDNATPALPIWIIVRYPTLSFPTQATTVVPETVI
jgi:hypothetical protein